MDRHRQRAYKGEQEKQTGNTTMRWEYRTVMFDVTGWFLGGVLDGAKFNDRLNQLGEEGWELVSVFDTNLHQGGTRNVVAVLKRPLSESALPGA
jgi:hypothetical protein